VPDFELILWSQHSQTQVTKLANAATHHAHINWHLL
jgi:hypothetical protein